jgi:hypothetical protein
MMKNEFVALINNFFCVFCRQKTWQHKIERVHSKRIHISPVERIGSQHQMEVCS